MRITTPVAALFVCVSLSTRALAQESGNNKLFVSLFAGFTSSPGDLWSIGAQRVGLLSPSGGEVAVDSFALSRRARPGLAIGVSATYFPVPRFGYSFELSLFNPKLDTDCAMQFDSQGAAAFNPNRATCADISRRGDSMGTVNVTASGIFRLFPAAQAKPYLRLIAGISDVGSGSTEVVGRVGLTDRVIVFDQGNGYQPTVGAALGFSIPTSTGYGVRLEIRDQLYHVRVLEGPADGLGIAPGGREWRHSPTVTVAFDIVLERKRGRRY